MSLTFASYDLTDAQRFGQIVDDDCESNKQGETGFDHRADTDAQAFDQLLGTGAAGEYSHFAAAGLASPIETLGLRALFGFLAGKLSVMNEKVESMYR